MKHKILELFTKNPKSYIKKIKQNHEMYEWVIKNSIINSTHFPSQVYSAVYNTSNICKYNQEKKFDRFSTGFIKCGPANICRCTKESISQNVSTTKKSYSLSENDAINKKRKKTMLAKYGVEYNSQRNEVKEILSKPKISNEAFNMLSNKSWLEDEYVTKNRSAVDIAGDIGVYYGTVIEYCKKHNFKIKQTSNYSLIEQEISNFIINNGFTVKNNTKELLGKKEIDILIPEKNFAIEVNGLYWHSYPKMQNENEDKLRHLSKTKKLSQLGINLIHITDWEWHNKQDIIKSILTIKLGKATKIPARKTSLQIVNAHTAQQFLSKYHIQGSCNSKYKFGLFYNNKLVMLLTAGKSRFNSNLLEIHRIASIYNTIVVGGASKLLTHLLSVTDSLEIISYCDRDKSNGNVYLKLGFTLERETNPGYFWTDGNNIISRYKCQKNNLKKWLPTFDQNLSESDNMFNAGYRRFWNCGNFVFVYKK